MEENRPIALPRCQCGQVVLGVTADPIMSAVCYCDGCQAAGHILERAPGAPQVVGADGGTEYCLYRKDRVKVVQGHESLNAYRLTPDAPNRRVVASCCNTPMFLDVTQGHWLSLYRARFSAPVPPLQMRNMTADRPAGVVLPGDLPSFAGNSPRFMLRLLLAWAAMGFRRPKFSW